MSQKARKAISGSDRQAPQGARRLGRLDPQQNLEVTLVLQRRQALPAALPAGRALTRAEHAARHGAAPQHLQAVTAFAAAHGLRVVKQDAATRCVHLSGPASAFEQAFGVTLEQYEQQGRHIHCHHGAASVPEDLQPLVMAVLGLDSRPAARPHFRRHPAKAAATGGAFTPLQVAQLYAFPDGGINGAGQTIAIIELGGGYSSADLDTYFQGLGLQTPALSVVSVDGGSSQPGGEADGEVMLDLEVAGAVAPGAKLVLYFTPNTDQGFHDAIAQAAADTANKPGILSISWGGAEDSWAAASRTAMNAALQDAASLGITVTVAAGDNGASDSSSSGSSASTNTSKAQLEVDFPASSPYVLSCGGTRLQASGGAITSERVWNELTSNEGATGGGVSKYFALPAWQDNVGVPVQPATQFAGRGVPDVSGDADPTTGYIVRVDGQSSVIGGTSAVAPLWAGLVALLNQQTGKPLGYANPTLYALGTAVFRDIVSGNNGYYDAGPGWDPCTGLGSPNGIALEQALAKGN
jgi:kumamolisin